MKWAFLVAFVAEFLLFDHMTSQHYARVYPRWDDQIQPLSESYTGYEFAQRNGFWSGISHTLAKPAAQGDLHSLWAILVFEVAGRPSRSSALAVNMLAFLVWQAALAIAIKRGTGSQSLAWIAIGLTLALQRPWSDVQGSATDFRLDHVSMCMMGISLTAALRAGGFRSTKWSGVFGVMVGITLLTRFVTGTYFAVIFGACAVWIFLSAERSRRMLNLGLAASLGAVLAGPCLWINRQAIYEHYWIGHYSDPNGILWSSHLSFAKASARLVEHLCSEQLGAVFGIASGIAIFVLAGGAWCARRRQSMASNCGKHRWTVEAAILGTIFLLAPALILALQNNDRMVVVVLGASVPGAVVLVLALCEALRTLIVGRIPSSAAAKFSITAALIASAIGAVHFIASESAAPFDSTFVADNRGVDAIADRIFATVTSYGIDQPRVAIDRVADYLDGTTLSVICYERHLVWVPFVVELPIGISSIPDELAMRRLGNCDFVIATENGPPGPWPYDHQMFALRPKILAWCKAHLRLVQRFTVFGKQMALYQRREIGMAPTFVSPPVLLGSPKGDFAYHLKVASGDVKYSATNLPAGLELDDATGWIRGRLTHAGTFTSRITATNSIGSTSNDFTFRIGDSTFYASVNAPAECSAGATVDVPFEAFDAAAELNFIDVTDQTTGKLLARLSAEDDEQQIWQGRYTATFSQPGMHSISMRFVRFEPANKNAYTFIDRSFDIYVTPAPSTMK